MAGRAQASRTSLVFGVIGHVDHGKTALVRALTGTDTDRLMEEKERGISIALGFAHLQVGPDTAIDLIDMPGHERFVRTMISGATGIDAVLLVVAANEGVKPQTVEHINIAALLGLRRAVVAVSKTDLVEAGHARRVADEAVRLLGRSGVDSLPPVMTSTAPQQGIEELRQMFVAELGGTNQDPNNPAYYERWKKAQSDVDSMLPGVIGGEAFMKMQSASADIESQPAPSP